MSQNLVTAARFINPVEADLFASELRSAGIECVVLDQDTAIMNMGIAMANGGIRVMVPEKDAQTAAEMYNTIYVATNRSVGLKSLMGEKAASQERYWLIAFSIIGLLLVIYGFMQSL